MEAKVNFKLMSFEGPLDLLLHLIGKNKIDIFDIPISEILSQYLEYLNTLKQMDMEITSDFIAMSAQLILIKSKLLLPKPKEEEEDPREELVKMLIEYQKYKEISSYFAEKELFGRNSYVKPPEGYEKDREYKNIHSSQELLKAFNSLIASRKEKLPPEPSEFVGIVGIENVSVEERMQRVKEILHKVKSVHFKDFFENDKNRAEIIGTFMAILELLKMNEIYTEDETLIFSLPEGVLNG